MDLEMVLNELSLRPLANDVFDARQRMSEFMQAIVLATKAGVKKVLRTSSTLNAEELATGYPVARWLNDANVDRDMRRFFLMLATKAPFLVDINNPDVLDSFGLSDFYYGKYQAMGLGVAFLLDALAVSFRSDPIWDESYLQLRINQIDDDGEIAEVVENIPHASSSDHVHKHLPWISARVRSDTQAVVREGVDIWQRKEVLFSRLYFCEQVKEQLKSLHHGDLRLKSILKRLYELEDFCNSWLDGPFDRNKIVSKATLESPVTLEKYSTERTFLCPDGVFRIFSWHVRLTPGAWRLYFYPLMEERKLIIGYIGPHLPTELHGH